MTTAVEIRQEMALKAPREKVWHALTTSEGWTGWFSPRVEGEFKAGEMMTLDFSEETRCYARCVEIDPMNAFAYQWHPGEDCAFDKYPEEEMTTVRFTLEDMEGGTKLTMVETGFERIPESRRANCIKMNDGGWKWELEELRAFVEEDVRNSKKDDPWPED